MSADLKPSEVLSKAADLIEPEGAWMRGQFSNGAAVHSSRANRWCAVGACLRISGDGLGNWFNRPYVRALATVSRVDERHVPKWNDEPGRTQAEVVAALRKASELAKAEGQ